MIHTIHEFAAEIVAKSSELESELLNVIDQVIQQHQPTVNVTMSALVRVVCHAAHMHRMPSKALQGFVELVYPTVVQE